MYVNTKDAGRRLSMVPL